MRLIDRIKQRTQGLRAATYALYLAARDPRTPWYARLLVAGIVAYALSPIDLIPDFIPVLGYLDDLLLIPLGFTLAMRLMPPAVLAECRARAQTLLQQQSPVSHAAGVVIVLIWLALAALGFAWLYTALRAGNEAAVPQFDGCAGHPGSTGACM